MTDPAPLRRRRIARIIIGVFTLASGVGITLFAVTPAATPSAFLPCHGEQCIACVAPSVAQCVILTRCGGEPCPDIGAGDEYAGVAGRLARGLRELRDRGAIQTFHTDIVSVAGGAVTDCATVIYMDQDQRAAWRRTVDAAGVGSEVVDCRFSTMPAKFKRNGVRRSTLAGATDLRDGLNESAPDDTVGPLDAGTE